MRCPRCDAEQPDAAECIACGVIIARAQARQAAEAATAAAAASAAHGTAAHGTAAHGTAAHGEFAAAATRPTAASSAPSLPPRAITATSRATRHALLRELGEMVTQGVPLPQALAGLEAVFRTGERARTTRAIATALRGHAAVSEALVIAGFDPVEVALVRAAERTGGLGAAFGRLASRLEVEQAVAAEVRRGLLQPVGMLLAAAVLLPAPLAIDHGVGAWLAAAATGVVVVIVAIVTLAVGLPRLWTHTGVRSRVLSLAEMIPGLTSLVRRRRFALLFGVLGPALEAGIPLDDALLLAAEAVGEPRVHKALQALATRVRTVGGLSDGARSIPGIDEETLGRLASGELGGGLAAVASERATTYTRRHSEALAAAGKVLRAILSAAVMIAVSSAIAAQFGKMLGDPMSMMPSSERNMLERELQRAMPQLQQGLNLDSLDSLDPTGRAGVPANGNKGRRPAR